MNKITTFITGLTLILLIGCDNDLASQRESICISNLYKENRAEYDSWETKFAAAFPEYEVYDAGSHCILPNNSHLVTFSFFSKNKGRQMMAIFDESSSIIHFSEDISCPIIGDLPFPEIIDISDSTVTLQCLSGDAGFLFIKTFKVQLEDLHVELIDTSETS